MKLAVGFITYNENSVRYLPDFLPSLFAALKFLNPGDYQVYVFDNSAPDNNANRLALEYFNREAERRDAKTLNYETRGRNLGFARAYNIMINRARESGAEYFLVLNPDTLLEADTIAQLVTALAGDRSWAAASPKIYRWDFVSRQKTKIIDSCGLVLKAGLHFSDLGQGAEDTGQFDRRSIIGPSGAVGLFRLSALEKVKEPKAGQDAVSQYFDEHFFIYKEDCDLAYRLQAAGLLSRFVPTAIAYHDRTAASSGHGLWRDLTNRGQKSRLIRSWSFRNQHFLFVKHWKKQNFVNKIIVIFRFLSMFIFSLILEQFLLKQYTYILHPNKVLTNVK